MGIDRDWIKPMRTLLVRLARHKVKLMSIIHLTLTVRDERRFVRVDTNWLVVDCEMSYNAILGRPSLTALRATFPYIS